MLILYIVMLRVECFPETVIDIGYFKEFEGAGRRANMVSNPQLSAIY
jgi:hypothetical protein